MSHSQSGPERADEGWEADLLQSVPDAAWATVHRRALWRLRRRVIVAVAFIPLALAAIVIFGSGFPSALVFLGVAGAVVVCLATLVGDVWGTLRRDPLLLSVETLQAVGAGFLSDPSAWAWILEQVFWLNVIVDVAEARELGRNRPGPRIRKFETCRRITFSRRLFYRVPDMADAVLVCGSNGRAVCRLRDLIQESDADLQI
jgi:hypothetical protein